MKLEYLREFIELVHVRNFSQTASEMYISQSALSKHISAIERELGVSLLDHDQRGVDLTEMGQIAFESFSKIVSIYDQLIARASDYARGIDGRLRVGIPYFASRKILAPILKRFARLYPNVDVDVVSGQPDLLHEMLVNGDIDAAINLYCSTMTIPDEDSFSCMELTREKQVLLCGADCPLAQNDTVSSRQLEGQTLTCVASGALLNSFARAVKEWFIEMGIGVVWSDPISNADFISDAVLESRIPVIVPAHVASFNPDLIPVEISDLFPGTMALYTRKSDANPVTPLFKDTAYKVARTL